MPERFAQNHNISQWVNTLLNSGLDLLPSVLTICSRQRYSRYLPVQESPSPQSSPTSPTLDNSGKKSKESRASRANADPQTGPGKRRATMNSRDSAYDEAEQLRRAIEESKREVEAAKGQIGERKGKRSRSDSEQ